MIQARRGCPVGLIVTGGDMATATELAPALRTARQALRRMAGYVLEPALDARLRDLGERKEFLSPAEYAELQALVSFTQRRTQEKLEAELALRQLGQVAPETGAGL
jgi:hypothetical protein